MNEEKRKRLIELGEKMQDAGDSMQKTGDKMSRVGGKLTIGITVPILLTLFLGIPGLIIGIIVFIGTLGSIAGPKQED